MRGIIDKALANYTALPRAEQDKIKAAWSGIGLFFLYLLYEAHADGWRKALGVFLAVTTFAAVAAFAAWLGLKLGKVFGEKAGTAFSVIIVFGFIAFVIYLIGSHWGR